MLCSIIYILKKFVVLKYLPTLPGVSSKQKGSHLVLNFPQQFQILKGLTLKYFEQKASLAS